MRDQEKALTGSREGGAGLSIVHGEIVLFLAEQLLLRTLSAKDQREWDGAGWENREVELGSR